MSSFSISFTFFSCFRWRRNMAKVLNCARYNEEDEDKNKAQGCSFDGVLGERFRYEYLHGIARKKLGIKGFGQGEDIAALNLLLYKGLSFLIVNIDAEHIKPFFFSLQNVFYDKFLSQQFQFSLVNGKKENAVFHAHAHGK